MAGSPATLAGGLGPSLGSAPSASLALVSVPFRGGHLLAAQLEGEVWVPLLPVCEALGVSLQGQLAKLRAKPWATIKIILSVAGDGKARQLAAVDLRSLPLWLATIEPSRVKPEAREALVSYQREAAEVLFKHFLGPSTDPAALASLRARVNAQAAELQRLKAHTLTRTEATELRYRLKHLEELQAFAIATNVTPAKVAPPPVELTEELVQKVWRCVQKAGWARFTAGQVKVKDRGKRIGRANDTAAALSVLVARGLLMPTSAKHGRAYLVVGKVAALWPASTTRRPAKTSPRPGASMSGSRS